MTRTTIDEVLQRYTAELMEISGIVGIGEGICDRKPCIRVFVTDMKTETLKKIPTVLGDYPVYIEETGDFKALK